MRALFMLVLLAGAGAGAWYFWNRAGAAEPTIDPKPKAEEIGIPTIGISEPPAAAKPFLEEGERLWSAAGNDPARSGDAPRIALAFSRALRALDGLPGQQPRADRLIADRLTPLGTALFHSKASFANDSTGTFQSYKVVAGDSPDKLAKQFGMSREMLNRLRGVAANSGSLNAGETITTLRIKEQTEADRVGYSIVIDKSEFRLDLYIAGIFARRYQITHGATTSPTPLGTTTITAREWHPQWTNPKTGKVLMYGDPENILGPIWLAFASEGIGKSGIGIHGYTGENPEMGIMASNGCIRLRNNEAEELYQSLPRPMHSTITVTIRE